MEDEITATFAEMSFVIRVHELSLEGFSVTQIAVATNASRDRVRAALRLMYARQQLHDAQTAFNESLLILRETP